MMVADLPLILIDWPTMCGSLEIALPDFVTQNCHLLRARFVVLGGKIAAHDGRHRDDPEKILRHITAGVTLRIVAIASR